MTRFSHESQIQRGRCGAGARGSRTFVVEILSTSNESEDLVRKCKAYEALPAVEEYLILDSRRIWARIHRRDPQTGNFVETDYREGDDIRLASIETVIRRGSYA